MPTTTLRCELLTMTPSAEALIYTNAKQCVSENDAIDIFQWAADPSFNYPDNRDQQCALIRRVIASGHLGVIEPVQFTFGVSGVSRALSHQLVRHRIASYSQQSQRYVKAKDFDYIIPPSIEKGGPHENYQGETVTAFHDIMRRIEDAYDDLLTLGIPAEDARFVLPNACETKLVVTMNCRSLLHFFEQRCCMRAQWEIRALANAMLAICREKLPVVFENAGALCNKNKFCDEHDSCGRYPKRADMKASGAI